MYGSREAYLKQTNNKEDEGEDDEAEDEGEGEDEEEGEKKGKEGSSSSTGRFVVRLQWDPGILISFLFLLSLPRFLSLTLSVFFFPFLSFFNDNNRSLS